MRRRRLSLTGMANLSFSAKAIPSYSGVRRAGSKQFAAAREPGACCDRPSPQRAGFSMKHLVWARLAAAALIMLAMVGGARAQEHAIDAILSLTGNGAFL